MDAILGPRSAEGNNGDASEVVVGHNTGMKPSPSIHQLKVTLTGIDPPIWRQIEVPSSIKLCCLHSALQVVMGWTDSHLHRFERDGKKWGVPESDEFNRTELQDENKTQLRTVLTTEGDSMVYLYDFGDGWRHEVLLEKIVPVNEVAKTPMCFGGERQCPAEDGGRIAKKAGRPVSSDFDLRAVNHKLSRMKWPVTHKR